MNKNIVEIDRFLQIFEDISEDEFTYMRNFLDKIKDRLSQTTSIQI